MDDQPCTSHAAKSLFKTVNLAPFLFARFMVFVISGAVATQVVQSPKHPKLFRKMETVPEKHHLPAARTHISPYIPILGPLMGY